MPNQDQAATTSGPECSSCKSRTQYHKRIVDPNTGKTYDHYECAVCGNLSWFPVMEPREMWHPIRCLDDLPTDRTLRFAVVEKGRMRTLDYPCLRKGDRLLDASTGRPIDTRPTHWREWKK